MLVIMLMKPVLLYFTVAYSFFLLLMEICGLVLQVVPGCMLEDWEENLAIISANRTKGDELVITHLGDCLWRERDEVWCRTHFFSLSLLDPF